MECRRVNETVTISGYYFKNKQLETFPKRMEYAGKTYNFLESGWRYFVQRGQDVVRIFDVTDGEANYRLKEGKDDLQWTLLNIRPTS